MPSKLTHYGSTSVDVNAAFPHTGRSKAAPPPRRSGRLPCQGLPRPACCSGGFSRAGARAQPPYGSAPPGIGALYAKRPAPRLCERDQGRDAVRLVPIRFLSLDTDPPACKPPAGVYLDQRNGTVRASRFPSVSLEEDRALVLSFSLSGAAVSLLMLTAAPTKGSDPSGDAAGRRLPPGSLRFLSRRCPRSLNGSPEWPLRVDRWHWPCGKSSSCALGCRTPYSATSLTIRQTGRCDTPPVCGPDIRPQTCEPFVPSVRVTEGSFSCGAAHWDIRVGAASSQHA